MTARIRRLHYGWIVLGTVVLVMLGGSGLRAMFGVFIKPMEAEFGWDRASLSGAAALSLLLLGAIGPFWGWLADRWGPRRVILLGCVVLGIGTVLSSRIHYLWQIYLTAGVLMALGSGGLTMSTGATVAARWFESRRGLLLGIALPLVFWLVRNDPADKGLQAYGAGRGVPSAGMTAMPSDRRVAVGEAMQVPAFWLLAGTFFICGYTSNGLVLTHLVPHAAEHGFSEMHAAQAL